MKTKELVNLLKQGVKPTIKFTDNISDIESADPAMLGRVIGFKDVDIWERGTETVTFVIDMSEFYKHNESVAQLGWKGENGEYDLTWMQTKYYPTDHKESIVEMLKDKFKDSDLSMFEVVEVSKHFEEFCAQEEIEDYVQFLEKKLDEKGSSS